MERLKIGVLALQGAFLEHVDRLRRLGVEVVEVKTKEQLEGLDGLVLPGGESTAMVLIAERQGMLDALKEFTQDSSKAVWGTCAGLILLSNQIEGQKKGGQKNLGGLDVTCSRNFFGRQKDSFVTKLLFAPKTCSNPLEDKEEKEEQQRPRQFEGVFIRAPAILSVDSPEVTVLAELPIEPKKGKEESEEERTKVVVAVQQGRLLGTAFHPELTDDLFWHQYFIDLVNQVKQKNTKGEEKDVNNKISSI